MFKPQFPRSFAFRGLSSKKANGAYFYAAKQFSLYKPTIIETVPRNSFFLGCSAVLKDEQQPLCPQSGFDDTFRRAESPLPKKYQLVYSGPLSKTAKYLKLFSVSSLIATLSLAPLIFYIDSGLSSLARMVLLIASIATSGTSTALIHWCIHPYVTRCWVNIATLQESLTNPSQPGVSDNSKNVERATEFCFESLDFFGKHGYNYVYASEFKPSSRLFTSHCLSPSKKLRNIKTKVIHKLPQPFYYLQAELAEQNPITKQLVNMASGKLDALRGNAFYEQK